MSTQSTQEIQHKEIDGINYICEMMPALTSNATLIRLTSMVGRPALVTAAGVFAAHEDAENGNIPADVFVDVVRIGVEQVFAGLTPAQGEIVLLALMNGVKAEGVQNELSDTATFNKHFRGRLLSAYKVWAWSLQCNYRDFIAVAQSSDMIKRIAATGSGMLEKAVSSMSTSTQSPEESPT